MKLSLDFQIKSLDGKDMEGEGAHLGKTVANVLTASNKGQAVKLYDWAVKLFNRQDVELDSTDKDTLIGFLESTENVGNLVKAQAIKAIKEQAEKKD